MFSPSKSEEIETRPWIRPCRICSPMMTSSASAELLMTLSDPFSLQTILPPGRSNTHKADVELEVARSSGQQQWINCTAESVIPTFWSSSCMTVNADDGLALRLAHPPPELPIKATAVGLGDFIIVQRKAVKAVMMATDAVTKLEAEGVIRDYNLYMRYLNLKGFKLRPQILRQLLEFASVSLPQNVQAACRFGFRLSVCNIVCNVVTQLRCWKSVANGGSTVRWVCHECAGCKT